MSVSNIDEKMQALRNEIDKMKKEKSSIDPIILASVKATMELYNEWHEMNAKI